MVHPRFVLAAVAIAVVALGACGSDDSATESSEAPVVAAPTEVLSAEKICERLAVDSVRASTGLDITRAVPDDSATPQCAYEYTTDSGGVSNLTVASMRPEDVGGLTGGEAFDFVVRINETVAGEGAETQEVSAGNAAIRISGSALQLGVVQVGDRVLTLIIPTDDVEPDAVDRLIAAMATALV